MPLIQRLRIYRHQSYLLSLCVCTLVSCISFARSALSSFLPWQVSIYISKVQLRYESLFLLSPVSFIFNLYQSLSLALSHTETHAHRFTAAHSTPPRCGFLTHSPSVVSIFHSMLILQNCLLMCQHPYYCYVINP